MGKFMDTEGTWHPLATGEFVAIVATGALGLAAEMYVRYRAYKVARWLVAQAADLATEGVVVLFTGETWEEGQKTRAILAR